MGAFCGIYLFINFPVTNLGFYSVIQMGTTVLSWKHEFTSLAIIRLVVPICGEEKNSNSEPLGSKKSMSDIYKEMRMQSQQIDE